MASFLKIQIPKTSLATLFLWQRFFSGNALSLATLFPKLFGL
jgi:hypothetical protein